MMSRTIPPAIERAPCEKWSSRVSSSPSATRATAATAAVVSIFRVTRALVAASMSAVMSRNGTSAIFGPIPISSRKNRSIATVRLSFVSKAAAAP